ncbi:alpha-2-macroglobulin family protein [Rhodobacteraceae bacterium CCMM004]|nr:alpha-2-macroglobulin family protein [Rhodobacteraceae bacterium CCMM004]
MRRVLAIVLWTLLAGSAAADVYVDDRRLVVSPDTDFFGSDLRTVFDTTFEACRAACLADPACKALTFNERSNACFPKSGVVDRQGYVGALSAEVRETDPGVLARASQRAAELSFLRMGDLEAARDEARAIALRHPSGGRSAVELLQAARSQRAAGNVAGALRLTGEALALSDAADLWTEYARLSLAVQTDDRGARNRYRQQALAASVAGYLRASGGPVQAAALDVMAQALERLDRGRASIPALRLAQSVAPRDDIAAALERAVARFGFRIVGHEVESDAAAPRICVEFSEDLVEAGVDYAPFVGTETAGLNVAAEGRKLCVDGVDHGTRYRIAFREGLPAASGETLEHTVPLTLYVRDRSPEVRFPGRGYVLPAGGEVALPVVTVNLDEVDLVLLRVSDRNLIRAIQQDMFGRPVPQYRQNVFADEIGQEIWRGTGAVELELNRDVTTRLPLERETGDLTPGVYALQANVPGADPYDSPAATQWFVVSDLGMTTLAGTDGLHGFVRSLDTAGPIEGVELTLLSRVNAVLGTAVTDAAGHAVFDPGLARGTGGAAPALLLAETEGDMAFLPLTGPEFDLSDRGVEGRAPAGPIDAFLTTERGVYRAGETVTATVLMRDARARALPGVPVTAVLTRPDGVEWSRTTSTDDLAGGHVFRLPTSAAAPRGTWRLAVFADVDAPPLASQAVLIEDFLPERIDADLALADGPLSLSDRPPLTVTARYLFGAPGADLPVEAEVRVAAAETVAGWEGYRFGRHDRPLDAQVSFAGSATTDAQGRAVLALDLPDMATADRPLTATVTVRVSEGSGRPIERQIVRPVAAAVPAIGIRPEFDGTLPEGAEASFLVAAVAPDGQATAMPVRWTLNRIETRYQWFSLYGNWDWEPVTTRTRIATGETALGAAPERIAVPVDWGRYELRVEPEGGGAAAASVDFSAGWYAPADAVATPDTLEVSLDAERYAPGDTATLRIVPRYAGEALVTVVSDRLIDMKAVSVGAGETLVELPVTEDWGTGVYVAATVLRPSGESVEPARALGLAHAGVDPGDRALEVAFVVPDEAAPRGPLEVALRVDGVAEGETAYAVIAAVDVGILTLTGFDGPDPAAHYFGQRKLGVAFRDLYGRLIDGRSGAMGAVRSGGDAGAQMRMDGEPPEDLLAVVEGPVEVGADGLARVRVDLPAFNGTVRLMAVVWSPSGVGGAEAEVLVRDPIVAQVTLPRFLAPGDTSRALIELTHASGPTGAVGIELTGEGVTLGTVAVPGSVTLGDGETRRLTVPITAGDPGLHRVALRLTTPGGARLEQSLTVPVRLNDPEVHRTSRFNLAAGDAFIFDANVFDGFVEGSGAATLTAGALARFDVPGLLAALDLYPYGCTEQVTSQALPLLYLSSVARAMGQDSAADIDARLDQAVARILSNQAPGGGFGLWAPVSGDFWLDAYVTDFLSRARSQGVAVPDVAFRSALDNLRNRVNYAPDFDNGGEDIAYALHVLAREGAAAIGDLRYYADVKAQDFATPLALAQLGAALAAYGDPSRADALFVAAGARLEAAERPDRPVWRSDYGTPLRDRAAVLTLAVEAGAEVLDRERLASAVAPVQGGPRRSTQEAVWTLMAANALIGTGGGGDLSVDGSVPDGPLIRVLEADTATAPVIIRNETDREATLTLTAFGVPEVAPPAGGEGYAIERQYFSLDGAPADPDGVAVGTRLVTVLTVQPFADAEARLMVDDPLPAGFEIDNPNLIRAGDVRTLDWLDTLAEVRTAEFRADRFLAAVDWRSDRPFRVAYMVRAISPGSYRHPAASVEDMYRPRFRAHTATGRIDVVE